MAEDSLITCFVFSVSESEILKVVLVAYSTEVPAILSFDSPQYRR